jgi:hypothetical protein
MRGGLGVRKKLSEESLRPSYKLNGVRTGFAVARCFDKYGRWEGGYAIGLVVRKTSSIVQIRWLGDEDISTYDQGDARYEVERGRWRILGPIQKSPMNPDDPLADALTELRQSYRVQASESQATPAPKTEEEDMADKMSNAAAEREAAQKALQNGDFKDRDIYTAKQIAGRCGTDAKTMRKFFRSPHSTVEPVGQGGRYEFDSRDFPKIKREFDAWRKKAESRKPFSKKSEDEKITEVVDKMAEAIQQAVDEDMTMDDLADAIEHAQDDDEPTPEELAELDDLNLDLELDD